MLRVCLGAFLLLFLGCSPPGPKGFNRESDQDCPGYILNEMEFVFCDQEMPPYDNFGLGAIGIIERMNDKLIELGMRPMSFNGRNVMVSIRLFDMDDPPTVPTFSLDQESFYQDVILGGYYNGHFDPTGPYLQVWPYTKECAADESKFAHEVWHMYEDVWLGHEPLDFLGKEGTHFFHQQIGDEVIEYGNGHPGFN